MSRLWMARAGRVRGRHPSRAGRHALNRVASDAMRRRFSGSATQLVKIGGPGARRGVGKVGEHAIDAEAEELQIFALRIPLVVGGEIFLLVAEGEDVDEQAGLVGIGDE